MTSRLRTTRVSPGLPSRRAPGDRAFTVLEILVTITVISLIAVIAFPRLGDDRGLRLAACSTVLISDIEYARTTTMADPADPVVVQFDPARPSYWLARASSPKAPILHPGSGDPYVVVLGEGRASAAGATTMSLSDMPNERLVFQAQGALEDPTSSPMIRLSLAGVSRDVAIASTGQVTAMSGQ